jgi:leader peptidase (prepilin peptidase)/N-methyltransferase
MLLIPWYLLLFALGAAVGSFLNVCIYRIPFEKSIIWPGSRCGRCLQRIRWYDNLPLLSYVLLRGRCRTCGTRFSARYFLIELLTGLCFAGLFYLEVVANVHDLDALNDQRFLIAWGVIPAVAWVVWAFHAILLCFLIVASFTDFDHLEIPLPITVTGAVVGLVGAVLLPWPWPYTLGPAPAARPALKAVHQVPEAWKPFPLPGPALGGAGDMPRPALYPWPVWNVLPPWLPEGSRMLGLATGLAGLLAGAAILRTIAFLFKHGRGMEGLGLGDADLMMMVGCFVGWQVVVVAFFVALAPGIVFGLGRMILRSGREMPFGPSLAVGTLVTLLCWRWIGAHLASFFFDPVLVGFAGTFMVVGMTLLFWMMGTVRGRGGPPEPPAEGAPAPAGGPAAEPDPVSPRE